MMKKLVFYGILNVIFMFLISCNLGKSNAEKVFYAIGVNANKIPISFRTHFNEIRAQKKAGSLIIVTKDNQTKNVNATEFVDYHYSKMFDKTFAEIKNLNPDSETKPIIDAGLDLFQYADSIYKNDFPRIAKMIDDGESDENINREIQDLDDTKGLILDEKHAKTMGLIIPYADKHGVNYKVMETPTFNN